MLSYIRCKAKGFVGFFNNTHKVRFWKMQTHGKENLNKSID